MNPCEKKTELVFTIIQNELSCSDLMPQGHKNLSGFIYNTNSSPLRRNNSINLLLNGEEKFPNLLKASESANSYIHLEYNIYEDDQTSNSIADILIKKAREGLEVRFLYDDFGSHGLKKSFRGRYLVSYLSNQ